MYRHEDRGTTVYTAQGSGDESMHEDKDNNIIQAEEEGMTISRGRLRKVSYHIAETAIATWFYEGNTIGKGQMGYIMWILILLCCIIYHIILILVFCY